MDTLLERLGGPLSANDRGATIREIHRRVAEDVPMIFTVYVPRLAVSGSRLEGFAADLNGPFSSVTQWWIPPEKRR
jgi:ABC-type transport system substrate-binding protein